ncbi:MAG: hypothetical protein ACJ78M_02555 [Gemmatimonadaceae bacterium]
MFLEGTDHMAEARDQLINSMDSLIGVAGRDAEFRASAISRERLSDALRIALEEAAMRSAESMLALRIAVELFTADLRDAGMTPEGVLVALKKIVRSRTDSTCILMRDQISTWCIEEFFANKKA